MNDYSLFINDNFVNLVNCGIFLVVRQIPGQESGIARTAEEISAPRLVNCDLHYTSPY